MPTVKVTTAAATKRPFVNNRSSSIGSEVNSAQATQAKKLATPMAREITAGSWYQPWRCPSVSPTSRAVMNTEHSSTPIQSNEGRGPTSSRPVKNAFAMGRLRATNGTDARNTQRQERWSTR